MNEIHDAQGPCVVMHGLFEVLLQIGVIALSPLCKLVTCGMRAISITSAEYYARKRHMW